MPDENDIDTYINSIHPIIGDLRKSGKYYKYASSPISKFLFFIKYLIKRLSVPTTKVLFERLETILGQYAFETSKHAGVSVSSAGKKEWLPKDFFDEYQIIPFEDRKYMAITKAEEYLDAAYGNWHIYPPEHLRVPTHFSEIYIK